MFLVNFAMEGDECHGTLGVFSDPNQAHKYAEIQDKLDDTYHHWVQEVKLMDDEPLNDDIRPYYSYYTGKEDKMSLDEILDMYFCVKDWLNVKGWDLTELESLEPKVNLGDFYEPLDYTPCIEYIKEKLTPELAEELLEYGNEPDFRWDNDEDTTNKIYAGDIIVDETDDYIEVFSVNSFQEAKETALKLYKTWCKQRR